MIKKSICHLINALEKEEECDASSIRHQSINQWRGIEKYPTNGLFSLHCDDAIFHLSDPQLMHVIHSHVPALPVCVSP